MRPTGIPADQNPSPTFGEIRRLIDRDDYDGVLACVARRAGLPATDAEAWRRIGQTLESWGYDPEDCLDDDSVPRALVDLRACLIAQPVPGHEKAAQSRPVAEATDRDKTIVATGGETDEGRLPVWGLQKRHLFELGRKLEFEARLERGRLKRMHRLRSMGQGSRNYTQKDGPTRISTPRWRYMKVCFGFAGAKSA